MIYPTGFLADELGAFNFNRLLIVASSLLIAGMVTHELFGTDIIEHVTSEDPGVDAFGAELGLVTHDVATR